MDPHEAHAEAIRSNNLLLKGTYEDGYKAGYEAGKKDGVEAGLRRAAEIADKIEDEFIAEANLPDTIGTYSRHCGDCASGAGSVLTAILAEIKGE